MLTTIAPSAHDHDADVRLVRLVLGHASATAGVVSRYATHSDPAIRLRVATHPLVTTTALHVLEIDAEPPVRDAARARLTTT